MVVMIVKMVMVMILMAGGYDDCGKCTRSA